MVLTSNLGYPQIGLKRELKFALEAYWNHKSDLESLLKTSQEIQISNWQLQQNLGIDLIPSNDFSLYDHVLDTAIMVNAIPSRVFHDQITDEYTRYFAMARGFQNAGVSIPAMEMTKWFNTNYHYIVPEISRDTRFNLNSQKPLDAFNLAKTVGIITRPVIIGPVTFLLLSKTNDTGFSPFEKISELLPIYKQLFSELYLAGVQWIQLDEPFLVSDLNQGIKKAYQEMFIEFSKSENRPKLLLTTYFDDISINKELISASPFEGLHIDRLNTSDPIELISYLPKLETLSLGIIDGRNIWKTDLIHQAELIHEIQDSLNPQELLIAPSCSMLHIPQDLELETEIVTEIKSWMSFAKQKLQELVLLQRFVNDPKKYKNLLINNEAALISRKNTMEKSKSRAMRSLQSVPPVQLERQSPFIERKKKQQLSLPKFPATTIGSFPQTIEIRSIRAKLNRGEINQTEYDAFIRSEIEKVIRLQEEIGLDVLVHGEFERNDMVQYFAEKMQGFTFTSHGWVQSYGSRYVRPPIIYGLVSRPETMTVDWAKYTQSLTDKPVKGMLTGPVTILQWSFVHDDQPRADTCREIALAIREEVLDLESVGIQIIQIDEPALREGLPIQKSKWQQYLSWAVECFKITSSGVKDETQIHTHMCYAEFNDIVNAIGEMDADVISIEASRSNMQLLKAFGDYHYPNDIGPGVYDIHSPNIPKVEEIVGLLEKALEVIPGDQLWVNPDCGLKTRTWEEVIPSLKAMVNAARSLRKKAL
ncbi:MAG: 5-methyltetrahydropteroyltriglutamate--homocysteine S-methyltransferase [Pelolinea sp.]|nr:5-methyltetrahydropteroyltriglutamate--homocysteine S-methyltransferase [Pelolinea sp.]